MNWTVEFEDDEEEKGFLSDCWCCWLTKEHLEAFIYWAIHCWGGRKQSGRSNIKYSAYSPLRGLSDDSSHHSENGRILDDLSSHSTRSNSSQKSTSSQRSNGAGVGKGGVQLSSQRGTEDITDEPDEESSSSSSDDEDGGLTCAPADRDYGKTNWLSSYLSGVSSHGNANSLSRGNSSHGNSSHGEGETGINSQGSNHGWGSFHGGSQHGSGNNSSHGMNPNSNNSNHGNTSSHGVSNPLFGSN
jgi:hypothetical protein